MAKTTAVIFTRNAGARVVTNPTQDVLSCENVVLNPDLRFVENHPPEHWKLVDGVVLPMEESERPHEEKLLAKFVVGSKIEPKEPVIITRDVHKFNTNLFWLNSALLIAVEILLIHFRKFL